MSEVQSRGVTATERPDPAVEPAHEKGRETSVTRAQGRGVAAGRLQTSGRMEAEDREKGLGREVV